MTLHPHDMFDRILYENRLDVRSRSSSSQGTLLLLSSNKRSAEIIENNVTGNYGYKYIVANGVILLPLITTRHTKQTNKLPHRSLVTYMALYTITQHPQYLVQYLSKK